MLGPGVSSTSRTARTKVEISIELGGIFAMYSGGLPRSRSSSSYVELSGSTMHAKLLPITGAS
jgi:hypothetical protein